jgi:hypothetical protein
MVWQKWHGVQLLLHAELGIWDTATTLTNKDCEELQKPVVNAILPNMGIARSAPRAVVFGKSQFGGLG